MIFEYDNININVQLEGCGEPLIMLHGWGCEGGIYAETAKALSQYYTVYIFDLPGFGQSDEPLSVWGTEAYTAMLHAFIIKQQLNKPILMGHSFGGRVSICYAAQHEVGSVVLIDSAGVVPKRAFSYYYKVYRFKFLSKLSTLFLSKKRAEELAEKKRQAAGSSDYAQASARMRSVLSRVVNEDLCYLMPKIEVPVLLFWGNKDTATPLSDAEKMKSLMHNAELVVASGAGHYSFLESKALFNATVKRFLKIN